MHASTSHEYKARTASLERLRKFGVDFIQRRLVHPGDIKGPGEPQLVLQSTVPIQDIKNKTKKTKLGTMFESGNNLHLQPL